MKAIPKKLPRLSLVAAFVASAVSFGATASTPSEAPKDLGIAVGTIQQHSTVKVTHKVRQFFPTYYIIQLESAPVASYMGETRPVSTRRHAIQSDEKVNFSSDAALAYADFLAQQQATFVSTLSSQFPSVKVERQLSLALNGIIVSHSGSGDMIAELSKLPGVKKVFKDEVFHVSMDTSNDLINSPEVWELAGGRDKAGENVKVAIIDTGIRPENPMFDSNGHVRPESLPTDDYCATTDESFCNDKLIVARFYPPNFALHTSEEMSPLDVNGHGSHVAGTAAGNHVNINYENIDLGFSGVAPGASLMVYKALWLTPEGQGSGSTTGLVTALEDAIADGADVINNSWGGGPGGDPANSVYTSIFNAAEEAGIVVVTAAGNDGPGAQTIGCPACAESGLTVANTQTGRTFTHLAQIPGLDDITALPGSGDFSIDENITGVIAVTAEINESNAEACSPFAAGTLENQIALLPRGTCSFEEKGNNVQAGGAIGMILYNNEPGIISMTMGESTLPGVSITQAEGETILELLDGLEAYPEVTITPIVRVFNDNQVDAMAASSSRGPNGDATFLKPDIAAPGTAILSAYASQPFNAISGTSMASPHVVGAAALLTQLRPELDARQVKSVLMTSSKSGVLNQDEKTPATPFERGAGRLDIAAALSAAVSFDTSSVAEVRCVTTCTFDRTVTNLLDTERDWTGTVSFVNPSISAELSTETLSLEADGTAEFKLTVDASYAESGWHFGEIVWTDNANQHPDARLPIAINSSYSDNAGIISSAIIKGEPNSGETLTLSAMASESGNGEEMTLTVKVPNGAELVPNSVLVDVDLASTADVTIAEDQSQISWTGTINTHPADASFYNLGTLHTTSELAALGITINSFGCSEIPTGCDEISANFTGFNFIWNNTEYSGVTISDNGFLVAGSGKNTAGSSTNVVLPDTSLANNIIAPLWADYAIGGANPGDIKWAQVLLGEQPYVIIEWENVLEVGSTTGETQTFSVWISIGGDEVFFYYGDVDTLPNAATVGIQGANGSIGTTLYHNGQGIPPTTEMGLQAYIAPETSGSIDINYDITPYFGEAESEEVATVETRPLAIDLGDSFSKEIQSLSQVSLVTSNGTYNAIRPLSVSAAEGEFTLEVVEKPAHGVLAENADSTFALTYTAAEGYIGDDSFSYRVVDSNGGKTSIATMTVTVAENLPPVAAATAPARVRFNEDVTLSAAESSDPNGDTLTYSWTQTAGDSVTLEGATTATATFTAPPLKEETTFSFEVTVSDGDFSDTATVDVVVERKPSSKKWYEGSLGGVLALLLLPLVYIRRRRVI